MTGITLTPMRWAHVPDVHDVAPLDADDVDCLKGLRDVLARHGRLQRFAVDLVQRHFDVAPQEVVVG